MSLLASAVLIFSGCSFMKFSDEAFAHIFSEVFEKKSSSITQEDLSKIFGVRIVTYSNARYAVVYLDGYSSNDNNKNDEFVKTIDLTDYEFTSFDDIGMLTSLTEFETMYVPIPDYSFLDNCTRLTSFAVANNYACDNYSFLEKFGEINELRFQNCTVDDISFISKLTKLKCLALDCCSNGDYLLSDISYLSTLSELEELSISSNMVYDLSPLSELKGLKSLNASYNCIDDVSSISQMTELVYIDLTQNPIKDLSSLTNFDPEKFEKIILDLNTLIKDWSPLDYLGNKVQGKPTPTELKKMAEQIQQ